MLLGPTPRHSKIFLCIGLCVNALATTQMPSANAEKSRSFSFDPEVQAPPPETPQQLAQLRSVISLPRTLGMIPRTSGGSSWPDSPTYEEPEEPSRPFRKHFQQTYIWPAEGILSSQYGWRWGRMHRGIDVANRVGTPIKAVAEGTVSYSRWNDGGYGYLVEITHPDGTVTLYAHNSRLMVREGQYVQQGDVISLMGSTGRSTGPHLHFEIRPPGKGAVNPLDYVRRPV